MKTESLRVAVVITDGRLAACVEGDDYSASLAACLRAAGAEVGLLVLVGDTVEDLLGALAYATTQHFDLVVAAGARGHVGSDRLAQTLAFRYGRRLAVDVAVLERLMAQRRGDG